MKHSALLRWLLSVGLVVLIAVGAFFLLRSNGLIVGNSVHIEMGKASFSSSEAMTAVVKTDKPEEIEAIVRDNSGENIGFQIEKKVNGQTDEVAVTVAPPLSFKPGKYDLVIKLGDKEYKQDFTWGVLAINTNKSIYAPNEAAKLSLAVLDETGLMVCDADVRLTIKDERLTKEEELSTKNGRIKVNPECKVKDYTEKPDYEAEYTVAGVGKYEMELTATTKNGTFTITDSFEVKDSVPFDVERVSATRIYPIHKYPVKMVITAHQDFTGEIREKVPYQFEVSSHEDSDIPISLERFDRSVQYYSFKEEVWKVSMKKGEKKTIVYEYDSPDESPYFFLLGPLSFYSLSGATDGSEIEGLRQAQPGTVQRSSASTSESESNSALFSEVFSEHRPWQIAVDVIMTGLEQQVNIIDQEYSNTSETAAPTDNSLGLVTFDSTKYTSDTVYFEAVAKTTRDTSTSNSVGSSSSMYCVSATDCKIVYFDNTDTSLRFKDCDDATCSTGSVSILDGATGCVLTGGDVCTTSVSMGIHSSIDCSAGASDCKIAYFDNDNTGVYFGDCDNASCSSGTVSDLDGMSGCNLTGGDICSTATTGLYVSLDCSAGATDCKMAYQDQGNSALVFADCADATCSSGSIEELDGIASCALTGGDACDSSADTGLFSSLDCSAGATDCKIAYYDQGNSALVFADCDDATCSTGSVSELDGITGCNLTSGDVCSTGTLGLYTSLDCSAGATDCKISYQDSGNSALVFADCDDGTCSTGSVSELDGITGCNLTSGDVCSTGTLGTQTSLDCSAGATDCKISYQDTGNTALVFADCDDATCSTGSVSELDGITGCNLTGGDACDGNIQAEDPSLVCSAGAGDCKISYFDSTNLALLFADCEDATCSTGNMTQVDGSGNDVGTYSSHFCVSATDCKVTYYDAIDTSLRFKDCDDATCSTGTVVVLDGAVGCALTGGDICDTSASTGQYSSLDCSAGATDCKISYYDSTNSALIFADCSDATCSSGSVSELDGITGCNLTSGDVCSTGTLGQESSLDCSQGATDCKISYEDAGISALKFGDCDDATCSTGSVNKLDGTAGCHLTSGDVCDTTIDAGDVRTSLDCSAGATDCKISYYDNTNTALLFGDCDDGTCSTGNVSELDGTASGCNLTGGDACGTDIVGQYSSLDCSQGATDCKISYYDVGNSALFFADCDDSTCSTGSVSELDGISGCNLTSGDVCGTSSVGFYSSLDCSAGATDCKISHYDSSNTSLLFADCDDSTCSTGSVSELDGISGCNLTSGDVCGTDAVGEHTSLDCSAGATDCKISYYDNTNDALLFADCSDATCSTGSVETADDGNERLWLRLYDSSGNPVPDGILSLTDTSYTRLRSNPLTLSNGTNYSVRISSSDADDTTAYVKAARLVIPQATGGGITDTESQVELGNNETTSGTSYTKLTSPKHYLWDTDVFTGTKTTYFEASMKGSGGGVTASASLSSASDCSSTVSGSEVTVTGTTWTLSRSSAITLSDDTEYFVCFKTSSGTGSIANAKLIIDQTQTGAIANTQVVHQLVNTLATDTDSTYTDQDFLNRFVSGNFIGDSTVVYYEATMKTSAGTGYTQLRNDTDGSAVSGGEISTSSTSYTRVRSSDLLSNMTTNKDYDAQVKNSASNTTSVASSWLLIQLSGSTPPVQPRIKGPVRIQGNTRIK